MYEMALSLPKACSYCSINISHVMKYMNTLFTFCSVVKYSVLRPKWTLGAFKNSDSQTLPLRFCLRRSEQGQDLESYSSKCLDVQSRGKPLIQWKEN